MIPMINMRGHTEGRQKLEDCIDEFIEENPHYGCLMGQVRRQGIPGGPKDHHGKGHPMGVTFENGRYYLKFDPEFTVEAPEWFIKMVLHHELWHIIARHNQRTEYIDLDETNNPSRDFKIWMYATDCAVNSQIPEVEENPEVKQMLVHPDHFDLPSGKTAEFYYTKIREQADEQGDVKQPEVAIILPDDEDADEPGDFDDAPDQDDDGECPDVVVGQEGGESDPTSEPMDPKEIIDLTDQDSDASDGEDMSGDGQPGEQDGQPDSGEAGESPTDGDQPDDEEQSGQPDTGGEGEPQDQDARPDDAEGERQSDESSGQTDDSAAGADGETGGDDDGDELDVEIPGFEEDEGGMVSDHTDWADNQDPASRDRKETQLEQAVEEAQKNGDLDGRAAWTDSGGNGAGRSTAIDKMTEILERRETREVNWRFHLRRFAREVGRRSNKPQMKFKDRRYKCRPRFSLQPEKTIMFLIDISGSMNRQALEMANSEIAKIANHCNIVVVQHNSEVVREDDYHHELPEINPGGGTNFTNPYDYYRERKNEFSGMIHFTDGRPNDNPDKPGFPILYAYPPSHRKMDWGRSVLIEPK